jgi:signal transduction histidine kinase
MELNILLIEDDAIDAAMVERLLGNCYLKGRLSHNPKIIHTEYFQKGLDILEQNKRVDVVILDLHLPDGAGGELVRQLSKQYSEVPIVVLTGLDADDTLGVELVREGAEDYVCKDSVSESSLHRSIRYAIERHSLANQVKRQAQELKESNEELESFTYIASHDLRAPLVNIRGFSAELKSSVDSVLPALQKALPILAGDDKRVVEKELQKRIPSALAFIESSAEKMDRLIEAILYYSRLGRRKLKFEQVDSNELVKLCLNALEHQIKTTQTTIELGSLPVIVADRLSVEQVFGNLLDNALKYLDPGRAGRINIGCSEDRLQTTFWIKDNGRGMAQDDQHKVFEIFRRAGNVDKIPGDGIGMPNARAIIKRHNGSIWFESALGKGTSFYFTIPKNLSKDAGTS